MVRRPVNGLTPMRLRLLVSSLTLAIAAAALAQPEAPPLVLPDTVTLDDALKIFRQRGLDLLIADAAVTNAEGDLKVAGAVPNPNWSLFGSYSYTIGGQTTPVDTASLPSPWGVSAGLGDSNALEDSLTGKRWLRLKVAKAALAAARL